MLSTRTLRYAAALTVLLAVPIVVRGTIDAVVVGTIGTDGGSPWWLPRFGTVGRTVATYGLLVSLVTYLVTPLLVFALGYRFGRDRAPGSTG
ncbi:hypothetical protein ACFQE8_05345 [Salinirubellus sp. GCM10025818]|uniref:hypothetical protein n=1 Tax=Salinirubellus TaxID=2162630 RepID=UPI0030D5CDCD